SGALTSPIRLEERGKGPALPIIAPGERPEKIHMETRSPWRRGHSIFGLIDDLREDARDLIHQEIRLAKTELSEKVSRLGRNAAYLAIGGVIILLALIFFLLALGFLIAFGFEKLGLSTEIALVLGFTGIAVLA